MCLSAAGFDKVRALNVVAKATDRAHRKAEDPHIALIRFGKHMDPLSQAAIGAASAQSGSVAKNLRHALWIGALAGMAPDLDVLIQSNEDPLLALEYHRQFTHSLLFIPIGSLICAAVFYPLVRKSLRFKTVWFLAALGYGSHGLLDACTTYGTQLIWPFTNVRIAWHNVSVIDPVFTLPLLGLAIACAVRHKKRLAVYGICWALSYLSFGLVQHQRALDAAEHIVARRGHEPSRLEVKPGFANLLVWKEIYEYQNRYYVDAVRAGFIPTYFPGESAAKLSLGEDFPTLDLGSQQALDVERFRWFSDDWLALDDADASLIVDMRYSQIPNMIKGLWGIRVHPNAETNTHAQWKVQRTTGPQELQIFREQLLGIGARPLPDPESPAKG